MKNNKTIAFVTTQALTGSTIVGRVLPLVEHIEGEIYVLVHEGSSLPLHRGRVRVGVIGQNPFTIKNGQKKRLSGFSLIIRLLSNTWRTFRKLQQLKPAVIVVVKTLPQNVMATWLYTLFNKPRIIIDIDDFELTANKLTSLLQRMSIHWAERTAISMAHHIVVATPFLEDHVKHLNQKIPVTLIPTASPVIPLPHNKPKDLSLGYIGSLSVSSGHRVDLLADIFSEVKKSFPDIELHIFGDGHDIDVLPQEAILHGRFNPSDINEILSKISVLIDPVDSTLTNRAKSSYRTHVAMLAGIPLVTSNVGIRTSLVPPQFQADFFAKPGDAGDYSKKIISLLTKKFSNIDKQVMREHAMQFNWPDFAQQYSKIIYND